MKTPGNILIFEAYTDANIGSGALVENTVRILRGKFPDSKIKIMAHYPAAFRYEGIESVADVFEYPFLQPRWRQIAWLIRTLVWFSCVYLQALLFGGKRFPLFGKKARYFQWADWVVSVGAERINDKFVKNLVWSVLSLRLLKAMGKKVVLFPCTIGPFLYGASRGLSASVLKRMDLIFTRDSLSTRICTGELNLPASGVIETSDVAVIQDQAGPAESRKLMSAFQAGKPFPDAEPVVGIAPLHWTYRANKAETPYSNYGSYLREMVKMSDALVRKYGVKIAFYPTNFPEHGCREDDVTVCREIRERMFDPGSSFVADRLTSPSQFKGMLSCSRVNIVTRMHACILSTGAGVPTLSINYLFKLREYMESLGLADFSLDIEDFTADRMLTSFDLMWGSQDLWRDRIGSAMEIKRNSLKKAMDRLTTLV